MSAGAVAKPGTARKIGAKSIASAKSAAEVTAVRPVLPPAATPDADSTYVVVVEVPKGMTEAQKDALRKFSDLCGNTNYTKKDKFFKKFGKG